MSQTMSNVTVPMSKGKRLVFIIAVYILYAGFSASGYGSSVLLPKQLTAIGGMDFYPLSTALGTLGTLLSLPLVGSLCDKFGSKAVTLSGVFIQLGVRIVLMTATLNPILFLVLYCAQSIGTGLYISAPYSLITDVTEPDERPKFFGYLVAVRSVGSLLGPLATGWLMDAGYVSLGWISYLPLMIVSVPVILAIYPNIKTNKVQGKFDFGGIFLLVFALLGIVLWLSLGGKQFEWISAVSGVMIAVGIISLVLLLRRESKHSNPSVPIRVFKYKSFAAVFVCIMLLNGYNTSTGAYAIAYSQQIMQVSSTVSATVTMPQTIVQAICSGFIGAFVGKNFAKRFRPMALLGMFMCGLACFIFFSLRATSPMFVIYAATAIGGFGTMIPQATFPSFFQKEVKPEDYRYAQSMFSFASTGGSCVFSAFAGVIMNAGMGYNSVFLLATILCAVAVSLGFIFLRLPKETSDEAIKA